MSALTYDHIRASLARHPEVHDLIDPDATKIRHLGEGTMSIAYLASSLSQELVVRTPKNPKPTPLEIDRYRDEQKLRSGPLKGYSYTPEFYYFDDKPTPHIVEARGEGEHPPEDGQAWTNDMIYQLGVATGALHAHTLQPSRNPQGDMQPYVRQQYDMTLGRTLELVRGTPAEPYIRNLGSIVLHNLLEKAKDINATKLEAIGQFDTIPSNLLFDEKTNMMQLIDWEGAHRADIAQSLATTHKRKTVLTQSHISRVLLTSAKQQSLLLDGYHEYGPNDPHLIERVRVWHEMLHELALVKVAATLCTPNKPHRWRFELVSAAIDLQQAFEDLDYPQLPSGFMPTS